jgi:hypothetical protein
LTVAIIAWRNFRLTRQELAVYGLGLAYFAYALIAGNFLS